MSNTNFWTYVIPYIEASIADTTQLIAGNNFDIKNRILWMQYESQYVDDITQAVDGIPAVFLKKQIEDNNEYCSSDKVFGNTNLEGSFPFKVVGHIKENGWNSAQPNQSNKYMSIASLGNIETPFFESIIQVSITTPDIQALSGELGSGEPLAFDIDIPEEPIGDIEEPELETETGTELIGGTIASFSTSNVQIRKIGNISFAYSYILDTKYRGEETLIKENWQQYTSEKSEYSGFNDAYNGHINDLISNSYIESNSDQKFFVFQKTTKPINLSYMSALPDPVIDDAASTTISDTQITTSGFTEAGGAIIANTSPTATTGAPATTVATSGGGY